MDISNLSGAQQIFTLVITIIIVITFIYELQVLNKNSLRQVVKYSKEISVKRFLKLRNQKDGKRKLKSSRQDVEGVYIIHNA